ncbi:MAG: protein kinase, partial [bacterium]
KTILHYKILEKLGEGGMGVVYKATDTKLKRTVAIKFLPKHIASNADERERFKIEAQAAAALNHPNIATIHAIEEHDGEMFIVMEFIPGKELHTHINGSPLPLEETIDIASQIAAGLRAAHKNNVVHRDIKSTNIMSDEDGVVKIMDFGLAKIGGGAQLTKDHSTLGTAAYMSPEQTRGEPVDHRTDIWSFGVVLYEMLTGQLPFRGEYEQAMIYSILNEEPNPISELREDVLPELEAIVAKSLAKDADARYQSAEELLHDLQQRSDTTANKATRYAAKTQSRSKTGLFALGAIAFVALIALLIYLQTSSEPKQIRLTNPRKITQAIGLESYPSWSPDGTKIAYRSNQAGQNDIWMKQLSGGEPINLTREIDSFSSWPSWSPDGSQIAFRSYLNGGRMLVMPAIGGPPRRIAPMLFSANPVWSADGSQLAHVQKDSTGVPRAEIHTLSTFEKKEVALPGEQFERTYLSWSPDQDYFAYADADNLYWLASLSVIKIVRISDGTVIQLENDGHLDFYPVWAPDGRSLYFISDRGGTTDLWYVKLGPDRKPEDRPRQISFGLGLHSLALSGDQTKIAFSREQRTQNLWRIPVPQPGDPPMKWANAQQLTFESSRIRSLDISPDGDQLYFVSDRSGNSEIWSMPVTGGERYQLTNTTEKYLDLHLSPDGRTLAFKSERSGRPEIWTMPASGGPAKQITNYPFEKSWPRWSPDGQTIAFHSTDSTSNLSLWIVPAQGGDARQVTTHGLLFYPLWWPDGKSLVSSDRSRLHRFPIAGGEPRLLTTPGVEVRQDDLRWSSDNKHIYFLGNKDSAINIWSLSVDNGSLRQLTDFSGRQGRLGRNFATDGSYFYFTWRDHTGDIWVMDVEKED